MLKKIKILAVSFLFSLGSIPVFQGIASALKKFDDYNTAFSVGLLLAVYVFVAVLIRKRQSLLYSLIGSAIITFIVWPLFFRWLDTTELFTF